MSLKVYDTVGRLVGTLAEGLREAGTHEVTFDGSNLAAGVYLVSLQREGSNQVEKLVLMK